MTLPKAKRTPDYSRMTPKQRQRTFREYRQALGFTQRELAVTLGWAEGTINAETVVSRKENGGRIVRVSDLLALECLLRRARKWPVR